MSKVQYSINSSQSIIFYSSNTEVDYLTIAKILETNTTLMENCFSFASPKNLQILRDESLPTPISTSIAGIPIIKLNVANGNFYAQYVFQFSHELCHVLIGKEKEHSHQSRDAWFEEVVCEVSSRFFLDKISKARNLDIISSYLPEFKTYALDRESMISTFDFRVLSNEESHLLNRFRSEIENRTYGNDDTRNHYNYIANFIHPIFEENPNLWQEVYFIRNFSNEKGFIENLISWRNESQRDENKKSIQKIINLFNNN